MFIHFWKCIYTYVHGTYMVCTFQGINIYVHSSGTPIFGICLVYAWYIPCICKPQRYTWYIHGISKDIPCISIRLDIDGISLDILGYTMYIHQVYTLYIHGYTWYIIGCIYMVYTWYIVVYPWIFLAFWNQIARHWQAALAVLLVSFNVHTRVGDQECFIPHATMAIAPGEKAAHKRLNPTATNFPRLSLVAAVWRQLRRRCGGGRLSVFLVL